MTAEYVPTDAQRSLVESASAFGITQAEIATQLKISEPTLRKHFRDELDGGAFKANMKVGTSKDKHDKRARARSIRENQVGACQDPREKANEATGRPYRRRSHRSGRGVVVQSAPHSPDGLAVYLGDLIAWPWRDPGPVPWRRCLGPDRRAVGVPGGLDYLLGKSEFPVVARPYPAFRSWYEDGCRDVRQLYPAEFYDKITKLPRLPYSSND